MACELINSWTFIGLAGAFLDLFIAYILLCGSSIAYLASKLLGLFGLSLPCPCNGLFGYPNKNICVQAILVNDPSLKISSVQSSAMKKLPFDSIWNSCYDGEDYGDERNDSQSNSEKWQNGNVEMAGEASCSSWHEKKEIVGAKKESFGSIPKRPGRPRLGFRRRNRAASDGGGKTFPSLYDPLVGLSSSASVGAKLGTTASTTSANSEDGKGSSKGIGLLKQGSQGFETDDDPFAVAKKELAVVESKCGGDKNSIRVLEQALDEEHAGRTALYLELEKERIAASTAADEAMAMILRLQEEKAAIEMEAKQYQRMIEEKTAFDAEEMNILKEILLRREREKLFLEKEVEAYKHMFFDKDQLDIDMFDVASMQEQKSLNEEPVLMSPQSVGEKFEITSFESPNQSFDFGKECPIPRLNEGAGLSSSIEKKQAYPSRSDHESTTPWKSDWHVKSGEITSHQHSTAKATEANIVSSFNNERMVKRAEDLHGSDSSIVRHILDVHVINQERGNKKDNRSITVTTNLPKTCDNPTTGGLEIEPARKRNSLERPGGLPPIGPSRVKSSPSISRRNSTSALDYEKFKIDNEVGLLRERLRIVQQGREKLNVPAERKEREQVQMQIMENLANQLREIRQLSEPGKALQQASLPPPSSKVKSKKRFRQGAPLGAMRSI
ncbi:pro-apoptotic serine protease [Gossypium arboreum]|uniref:Pro-apoptotic serine protease n=2 Tax=Gossypium arboreum TaxID=29729 RepID=A0A0B0N232_GOSAR|nr:myosin-binding protein 7 [Gossypium arboreum]XP_017610637.1 myosin-binding protein 7 [Gossypium arboreum]KAK5804808.1 hypothetical protein PVK06_032459 [Gossypium arboreum]KHG08423.1 pro-apoptotic serine protease [Gossypium arboreum]